MELQFHPDPACKLSANLYDIYHCCVYSAKLLMMGKGTVRNMQCYSKNKFEKSVHPVGFIVRKIHISITVTEGENRIYSRPLNDP